MKKLNLKKVKLENSDEVIWAHTKDKCKGEICCIHNRTDHHMRSWPQHWRSDRGIMERICPCGIGHPDEDDLAIREGKDCGIHARCGIHCLSSKEIDRERNK